MRFTHLVCLLLASLASGQVVHLAVPADAGKSLPDAASAPPGVLVGPDDPVITVNGFCPDQAQQGSTCKTTITRAQFEKLTEALQPGMSLSLRLKVANSYAQIMRMAEAAKKRGLDKTPAFEEEMRYARMQLLSQDLTRALHEDANNISDTELEDCYRRNESSFQEATVARIFIPHIKRAAVASEKPAAAEAMATLADALRARLVKGEDPDRLQAETYAAAGIPGIAPHTKMEKVRRTTLPPQHESVMDLKAGEVSEVFSDPGGGHFIYKVIGKRTLTLEEAKPEIRTQIATERFRDSMKPFQGDVVFSDAYFNPPRAPTSSRHRSPNDQRKTPPAKGSKYRNPYDADVATAAHK